MGSTEGDLLGDIGRDISGGEAESSVQGKNTGKDTQATGGDKVSFKKRLTHKTDALIALFKRLPLTTRLAKNKEIEAENHKKLLNLLGRSDLDTLDEEETQPASFITITDEEMAMLTKPNFYNARTEEFAMVPLPWFTDQNLRFIIQNLLALPTSKVPVAGEDKPVTILNIQSIQENTKRFACLHGDYPEDYSLWYEAANNHVKFQQLRDEDPNDPVNGDFYLQHYKFFSSQTDKVKLYPAWAPVELEIRRERRMYQYSF
ncbi:hypothetical protein BKA70DRAFT_1100160, partial [Coprinopsis sp. MPI-PUGE-AT-0042]